MRRSRILPLLIPVVLTSACDSSTDRGRERPTLEPAPTPTPSSVNKPNEPFAKGVTASLTFSKGAWLLIFRNHSNSARRLTRPSSGEVLWHDPATKVTLKLPPVEYEFEARDEDTGRLRTGTLAPMWSLVSHDPGAAMEIDANPIELEPSGTFRQSVKLPFRLSHGRYKVRARYKHALSAQAKAVGWLAGPVVTDWVSFEN